MLNMPPRSVNTDKMSGEWDGCRTSIVHRSWIDKCFPADDHGSDSAVILRGYPQSILGANPTLGSDIDIEYQIIRTFVFTAMSCPLRGATYQGTKHQ